MTKSLADRIEEMLADSDYPTLEDIEKLLRELQAENKRLCEVLEEAKSHLEVIKTVTGSNWSGINKVRQNIVDTIIQGIERGLEEKSFFPPIPK